MVVSAMSTRTQNFSPRKIDFFATSTIADDKLAKSFLTALATAALSMPNSPAAMEADSTGSAVQNATQSCSKTTSLTAILRAASFERIKLASFFLSFVLHSAEG